MSQALIIPLLALLESPGVSEGVKKRTIQGGALAEYALELCLNDSRDINEAFHINAQDYYTQDTFTLTCQSLETTTGMFYAVKGQYVAGNTLKILVGLFKERGINIQQ